MSFAQSQKRNNNERDNLVRQSVSSPMSDNLFASSSEFANCQREEVNQCQDSISKDEITKTDIKTLQVFCHKKPLGSSEIVDVSAEKMLVTPQVLPSKNHASKSNEAASATSAVNHSKLQSQKDCVERIEKPPSGTSHKKFSLVGKKLSLGSRGLSGTHNKENAEPPAYKRPKSSPGTELSLKDEDYETRHGNFEKHGRSQMESLSPLSQLQEDNKNHIQPLAHSESLFHSSQSIPKQLDSGLSNKKCSDQGKTSGRTKQTEAEELLTSDAVIVLDSEDSDEEKSVPSRSKPLLARKRLGKWKVRA